MTTDDGFGWLSSGEGGLDAAVERVSKRWVPRLARTVEGPAMVKACLRVARHLRIDRYRENETPLIAAMEAAYYRLEERHCVTIEAGAWTYTLLKREFVNVSAAVGLRSFVMRGLERTSQACKGRIVADVRAHVLVPAVAITKPRREWVDPEYFALPDTARDDADEEAAEAGVLLGCLGAALRRQEERWAPTTVVEVCRRAGTMSRPAASAKGKAGESQG